jgi:hypothetical protein
MMELIIPSIKTLEHIVKLLQVKDSISNPLITDMGIQESVFRRLGSITDNSPNTLVMDSNKENVNRNKLKIDISGNEFKFSKLKNDKAIEGKLYVFNRNQLTPNDNKEADVLYLKRQILLGLLRFRDSMELTEGKVEVGKMLRAKSLNFKCK